MPATAVIPGPAIAFCEGNLYRANTSDSLLTSLQMIAAEVNLNSKITVYADSSALFSAAYPRQIYALIKDHSPTLAAKFERASANNPREWFKALLREAIPVTLISSPTRQTKPTTRKKEPPMLKKDAAAVVPTSWAPGPKKTNESTKLPPQAKAILAEVLAHGSTLSFDELCQKLQGKLKTKQPVAAVVSYYQTKLIKLGLVTVA